MTPFSQSELANAVYRLVFLRRHSLVEARLATDAFQADCRMAVWSAVQFPSRAWETCDDLARQHGSSLGVRTLGTLHVACALELRADRFWTFDERQARLAEAVGLNTAA
jgi:predicted nucleic acid-binding protein